MADDTGFQLLVTNQGNTDRIIRAVLAIILLVVSYTSGFETMNGMIALSVAGVLIFNVVSGNCYIYRVLGINTCPVDLKSE
jgi:hypothetical protein|tara:strand:- start:388 stop:630 length:243 start_codon:yes stop_codon:yes gene_type:complete